MKLPSKTSLIGSFLGGIAAPYHATGFVLAISVAEVATRRNGMKSLSETLGIQEMVGIENYAQVGYVAASCILGSIIRIVVNDYLGVN